MAEDEGSAGGRWLRGGSTEATTPVMVSRWIAAVLARAMTRDGMDNPISRLDDGGSKRGPGGGNWARGRERMEAGDVAVNQRGMSEILSGA